MVPGSALVHDLFTAVGVLVGAWVFVLQIRHRRRVTGRPVDDRIWTVVAGALVGGALLGRLGTWVQHFDLRANATLVEHWLYGNRSILSGLVGAYVGALLAKRLSGYREKTGDLFAPAVAIGMAVGRVGCLLTELPGTPTGGAWGLTAWDGVPRHPSFAYEIAFHLAAFVVLLRLRRHVLLPRAVALSGAPSGIPAGPTASPDNDAGPNALRGMPSDAASAATPPRAAPADAKATHAAALSGAPSGDTLAFATPSGGGPQLAAGGMGTSGTGDSGMGDSGTPGPQWGASAVGVDAAGAGAVTPGAVTHEAVERGAVTLGGASGLAARDASAGMGADSRAAIVAADAVGVGAVVETAAVGKAVAGSGSLGLQQGYTNATRFAQGVLFNGFVVSYGVFRFAVEFVRGNEVVFAGLTRPQWFLLGVTPLVLWRGWRIFSAATKAREGVA